MRASLFVFRESVKDQYVQGVISSSAGSGDVAAELRAMAREHSRKLDHAIAPVFAIYAAAVALVCTGEDRETLVRTARLLADNFEPEQKTLDLLQAYESLMAYGVEQPYSALVLRELSQGLLYAVLAEADEDEPSVFGDE